MLLFEPALLGEITREEGSQADAFRMDTLDLDPGRPDKRVGGGGVTYGRCDQRLAYKTLIA